jgi:hypothetical protein
MIRVVTLILTASLLTLPGCIQRRIRVTSEPPGAVVWLNDTEIGRTPAEAEFTFYGSYDVRLELDGYEPIHTARRTPAPFYEYPGPDLIAEVIPHKFENVVAWHFDLEPAPERTMDPDALEADLVERARRLRRQTERDGAAELEENAAIDGNAEPAEPAGDGSGE